MTKRKSKKIEEPFYKLVRIVNGELRSAIANVDFKYEIGKWRSVRGELAHCWNGLHVALPISIRYWWEQCGPSCSDGYRYAIYEAQIGKEHIGIDFDDGYARAGAKICARRMKLLRRVTIAELKKRGHWKYKR